MANYATLIAAIQETIAANGNNEITGPILQQVLVSITNTLGSGYQFIGIATPETTPGTPDQRVFYIGSAGTYPNFGPAVIPDGNLAIFYYDSSWHVGSVAFPLGDGAVTTSKMANGAVTEQKIQSQFLEKLLDGYVYFGKATAATNPGTPAKKCFYVATDAGTYTNFGGLVVNDGEIAFLRFDSSTWAKDSFDTIPEEQIEELQASINQINAELRLTGDPPIPIPIPTSCGATINNENKWYTSSTYYGGLVSVTAYRGYTAKILANPTLRTTYAFLKSGVSNGNTPDYATGYTQLVAISAGQEGSAIIPNDAVYLFVYLQSPGADFRPTSITFIPPDHEQTRLEEIEENIAALSEELDAKTSVASSVNVAALESCGGSINNSTKKWVSVSGYYGTLIPIAGAVSVAIKANNTRGASYTFLKSGFSLGNDADFATGYDSIKNVSTGAEKTVTVPSDAVYLYIYLQSPGGANYRPQSITIFSSLKSKVEELEKEVGDHLALFTYNIGHFALGAAKNSTITASQYKNKVDAFRALLSTQKPNIYGIVEYSAIFGKNTAGNNVNTKDELFNFQNIQFESSQMNYACYALFGNNVPIYNIEINNFDCLENETITHTSLITAQDYRYISADLYAFGVSIKLIVTHLAFDTNRPNVLQAAEMSELYTKFASYPYVIMMGDFNYKAEDMATDANTNGYIMANDGSLKTYPSGNQALDNILVKGLQLSHVQMIASNLSDHYPIVGIISK